MRNRAFAGELGEDPNSSLADCAQVAVLAITAFFVLVRPRALQGVSPTTLATFGTALTPSPPHPLTYAMVGCISVAVQGIAKSHDATETRRRRHGQAIDPQRECNVMARTQLGDSATRLLPAPSAPTSRVIVAKRLATAETSVRSWISLLTMVLMGGCAATSTDIDAQYISADHYAGHTCAEIAGEGERVARRVAEISSASEDTRSSGWLLPPAIILLWPTILPPDDSTTADLRRLRGDFEALREASRRKRCSLRFQERFI